MTLIAEHGSISVLPNMVDLSAVEHGTTLVLTATPDEGYEFDEWINYDGTSLYVVSDTTVTATFKPVNSTGVEDVEGERREGAPQRNRLCNERRDDVRPERSSEN